MPFSGRCSLNWSEVPASTCWNSALTCALPAVSDTTRTVVSAAPVSGQSVCRITRPGRPAPA
ncbi:hypothetical protein NKH77_40055 [Streptomyces sp. M19]